MTRARDRPERGARSPRSSGSSASTTRPSSGSPSASSATRQAAQDVAQDVFITALRRFPDPGESEHAAAWVRAAAAHAGLNAIRGERRRDRRQQLSGVEVAPAGPEEAALDRESAAEVRRALARLPRRSAAVLVLRHSGLSYAEVAEAMNVKVGHVGTMLRRAESALRKELPMTSRQ